MNPLLTPTISNLILLASVIGFVCYCVARTIKPNMQAAGVTGCAFAGCAAITFIWLIFGLAISVVVFPFSLVGAAIQSKLEQKKIEVTYPTIHLASTLSGYISGIVYLLVFTSSRFPETWPSVIYFTTAFLVPQLSPLIFCGFRRVFNKHLES